MRVTRLYTNQPLTIDTVAALEGKAHHHLAVVLRARLNDQVVLFNGDNVEYSGVISAISKKQTHITLTASNPNVNESPLHIHLGQCISQNNRFDFAVQKASEMGVNVLTPIMSEHAQSLGKQQFKKRIAHWQQIAVNAAEQAHRATVPAIEQPIALKQWLKQRQEDAKWVCAIGGKAVNNKGDKVGSVAILIGPEGGLSQTEVASSVEHGFSTMTMGKRVLRTETTPIAAISLAQFFWGDITP